MEKNIWDYVKDELKYDNQINAEVYNTYISKSFLFERFESNLIIGVKDNISKNILTNINNKILNLIKTQYNLDVNIKYKPDLDHKNSKENLSVLKKETEKEEKIKEFKTKNKINITDRNMGFCFDNFISGECNKDAFEASKEVAKNPGKWNPLFIYGDSGLGKTHLLLSIKKEIMRKNNFQISYISSEEFGTLAIEHMQKGHDDVEEFKNNFKSMDVLLIDDIQLLAKRTKTNELFFYILNHFIENKKQIVISSDKLPDELKAGFEKRLISRFNSGLNIQISKPDFQTALQIIKLKLKNKKNDKSFSKESIEYIAKNFSMDVRKIEGAINRMIFYSILQKQKNEVIEISDIKEAFKTNDFKDNNIKKISVKEIQNIICSEYNITIKILLGKSRISSIAIARHVAMYFSRQLTDMKLSDIAQKFKRKDHTTVINSIKKIEKLMKVNSDFKKYLNNLEMKIKNS